MPNFFKNGTACVSQNLHYRQNTRKVNEYVNSNDNFNEKHQHSVNFKDEQQETHSLSSKLPAQTNTFTSSVVILKTPTSKPNNTDIKRIDGGPHSSELQTTTGKNPRHMSNIKNITFSESISTTPMYYSKPTKGKLTSTESKSSYVPWQMKFWNRAKV
jgi:hypothetical protein